jgi:iron(III) transport system permease protein
LTKYVFFHQLPVFWQSVLILTVNLAPLSFAVVWLAINAIERKSLHMAFLHAPPLSVIRYIVLPQLFVPLSMSSIVVFLSVFSQEEVTSFLGYRTYAEDFLSRLIVMTDTREVALFSVPFLFLAVAAVLFLGVIGLKKHLIGLLRPDICEFVSFSAPSGKSVSYSSLYAVLVIAAPLLLLVSLLRHMAFGDLATLLPDNFEAIKHSLLTASLVAFVGTAVGSCIYHALRRISGRFQLLVTATSLFGFWLLPPPLIGIGILKMKQFLAMNTYYFDMLVFYASYLARIVPVAVLLTAILYLVFRSQTDGVVVLMPVTRHDVFLKLRLPVNWPKWLLVWSILAALVLGELAMTILLVPPGVETVVIRIYNLMHYGDFSTVAFLSCVQVVIVTAIIFTTAYLVNSSNERGR